MEMGGQEPRLLIYPLSRCCLTSSSFPSLSATLISVDLQSDVLASLLYRDFGLLLALFWHILVSLTLILHEILTQLASSFPVSFSGRDMWMGPVKSSGQLGRAGKCSYILHGSHFSRLRYD